MEAATLARPRRVPPPDDLRTLQGPGRAPERSIQQRLEALERANSIRSRRAELKRDIKAGRKHVEHLLLAPPDYIETMKVFDLLLATPKWGRTKASKALTVVMVSPSKTIGGMTDRQRRGLVNWMRRRG